MTLSVSARAGGASPRGSAAVGSKVGLAVGWLALGAALVTAHAAPTTGYELSIYAATPLAFWIGVAIAFLAGLLVALTHTASVLRGLALVLGGAAVLAVVALPYVRGYAFYGTADPLTHLGLARGLIDGAVDPFAMVYPGVHSVAALVSVATGLPVTRAMLLTLVLYPAAFLLFVPLAVATIADRWTAVIVAAFAGAAFLPVNHVGTHFRAHPYSQTVLVSALLVFLALKHLTGSTDDGGRLPATAVLLGLSTLAVVLFHPQYATTLLLLFVGVTAVQLVVRRRAPASALSSHRSLAGPTAVFGIGYVLWVIPKPWFFGTIGRHQAALVAFVSGQGQPASRITTQQTSLFAIGASLPEMAVKLFLPTALFLLFAGVLVVAGVSWIHDARRRATLRYLWLGVGLGALFTVVYLLADVADMYFRHFAVVTFLATMLGALGLTTAASRIGDRFGRGWGRALVACVLVVAVGLSAATIYQSPYIYKANQHVTESQFNGYETAFDSGVEGVQIVGVRAPPERYHDAAAGPGVGQYYTGRVAAENLTRLSDRYATPRYVVVTQLDREREVDAYRELTYTRADFDALDAQTGVNHVAANGEVDLYLVSPADAN